MKKQILNLFNSVLLENEIKDAEYYRSIGFILPEGQAPPEDDKYVLSDAGHDLLLGSIRKLFTDIEDLANAGNDNDAFDAYKLIIRECAKLITKSWDLLIVPDELIDLLKMISYESRMGIARLVKSVEAEKFALSVFNWLLKEILRKEYELNNDFTSLCDLFIELCASSKTFQMLVKEFVVKKEKDESITLEYIRLAYWFYKDNIEKSEEIISENNLVFGLKKYFVELHYWNERSDAALSYAEKFLEFSIQEERNVSKMHWEQRAERYPDILNADLFLFTNWCSKFILDTLIENKYWDRAISYVSDAFLYNNGKGKFVRGSCVNLYKMLHESLPEEIKGQLYERLFINMNKLSVYAVRDLCEIENRWYPLIEAFKLNDKLSDLLFIYEHLKDHLLEFSSQLSEIFKNNIFIYAKRDSDKSRMVTIRAAMQELLLIEGGKKSLFELIVSIRQQLNKRKILLNYVDSFILEYNLADEYNSYEKEIVEKSGLEKIISGVTGDALVSSTDTHHWNDTQWADNKINELKLHKSIFELKKNRPPFPTLLGEDQLRRLLHVYRESIFDYVAKSKKDEATKSRNIKCALDDIKNHFGNEEFFKLVVSDLKSMYPKRIKLNSFLEEIIK